jgi:hypothetical protein
VTSLSGGVDPREKFLRRARPFSVKNAPTDRELTFYDSDRKFLGAFYCCTRGAEPSDRGGKIPIDGQLGGGGECRLINSTRQDAASAAVDGCERVQN